MLASVISGIGALGNGFVGYIIPFLFVLTLNGKAPSLSIAQVRAASPICFMLFMQLMRWAFPLARLNAGRSMAGKMTRVTKTLT